MVTVPRRTFSNESVLPGFSLTLGLTILYLAAFVFIPLSMIFLKLSDATFDQIWGAISGPRALASYRLTFGASFLAALVNLLLGTIVAWVLVRYRFPGSKLLDGLIDLPFALPTAVAGIALTAIYARSGIVGAWLEPMGIKIAFTPVGVFLALLFIGFPFVVRTLQPVLLDLDLQCEEAAATIGAGRWTTIRHVVLPSLIPHCVTGFSLAFARGLGEYGSVVFISGNLPMKTEIVPFLIMTKLEQFDYIGAASLALVMLLASMAVLLLVNLIPRLLGGHSGMLRA